MAGKINLDGLSIKELKDLRVRTDKAIASFEDRKKKEALTKLEETARKMGYSLADLTSSAGAKKRKPVAPKYANPADASETWTGRGRKPRWVEAALASGKSLDDLKI